MFPIGDVVAWQLFIIMRWKEYLLGVLEMLKRFILWGGWCYGIGIVECLGTWECEYVVGLNC